MTPDALPAADVWRALREVTRARIGLGRAGDALPTAVLLDLQADHAAARDAVHVPLDVPRIDAALAGRPMVVVDSCAADRATLLQRPDLGRRLSPASVDRLAGIDGSHELVVVLADGLSATAVHEHAPPLVAALDERLPSGHLGPVVLAQQARVALGDEVGAALGGRAVLVLIGERPGLTSPDSLGAYLTWSPRVGRHDAERNCVSNIRPPHGLGIAEAADVLVRLLAGARALGASGVPLKDVGGRHTASLAGRRRGS